MANSRREDVKTMDELAVRLKAAMKDLNDLLTKIEGQK